MTTRKLFTAALGTALTVAVAGTTQAAITYVDATTSNTTLDGNAIVLGTNVTTTRINSDDRWAFDQSTTLDTNFDSVFAAQRLDNSANTGQLATTVSGLAAETYGVYAFYWAILTTPGDVIITGEGWDITAQAGTNAPVTEAANSNVGTLASSLDITGVDSFTGGNRTLFALYLGEVTGTSITVLIDDAAGNDRTWYDGIGYEVVPEPSSLALLGLGGLLVARRRRQA